MDALELKLQVETTRAFILADPEDLVLLRRDKISDGSGGFYFDNEQSLPSQTARLIPQNDRVPEVVTSDGKRGMPEFVILLEPDADVQRYDQFQWKNVRWEIAHLHLKPEYELKGDVIRVG